MNAFHDLLARHVARHACEVRAESDDCPHLMPSFDLDEVDWTSLRMAAVSQWPPSRKEDA